LETNCFAIIEILHQNAIMKNFRFGPRITKARQLVS